MRREAVVMTILILMRRLLIGEKSEENLQLSKILSKCPN